MGDNTRAIAPSAGRAELAPPVDVAGLLAEWQADMARRASAGELAPVTVSAYARGMLRFVHWLERRQAPGPVDVNVLRDWLGDLRQAGSKPGSINSWLSGVRAFYTWAVGAGRVLANPCQGLRGAKRKGTAARHKRRELTDEEARRLLAAPDVTTTQGLRDKAILALMLYTGVRSIEVHRADLQDLRSEGGAMALYVLGKGRTERDEPVVLASAAARRAMYEWIGARGDQAGPLFTSLSNRNAGGRLSLQALRALVKGYMRQAGIANGNTTTHSLRHTAATNAIRRGAQPLQVKAMLRHESIETTMIYYHETERMTNPAEGFIDYGEE